MADMASSPSDTHPSRPLPTSHTNGGRYPTKHSSPLRTSVRAREKERLVKSIQSSNTCHQLVDLDSSSEPIGTGQPEAKRKKYHTKSEDASLDLKHAARDPRDEPDSPAPTIGRPASPYTLNPPVDFDGLSWPSVYRLLSSQVMTVLINGNSGVGTRARLDASPEQEEERLKKIKTAVSTILECIGEDPRREGLQGTPERYAKAMLFFTKGYEENVRDLVNGAVFHEDHDELGLNHLFLIVMFITNYLLVIVKDIEVFSLCEHHMVIAKPFFQIASTVL